jgi:hypothetical protein
MTSQTITFETIMAPPCPICHEHPVSRQVIVHVAPGIELTPLVCAVCAALPEHELKEKLL